MLRIATVLAALAAVFPAAGFAARRADTPLTPSVVARLVTCDVTSSDNRSATFYGRMESFPGASKMQLRFQLFERLGHDDTWNRLDVPGLRGWHTSQPGVHRLGWKQTVDALRLGGAYKARIQYRWLGAGGTVLDTATRDTPVCRGPLPNLTVANLAVKAGPTSDTRTYRVDVSNKGKLDATQVAVAITVDKAVLDTATIGELAVGETRSVSFTGPECRNAIRVKADPNNAIGESLENDNSELFACP
jgi:hypothetical protein